MSTNNNKLIFIKSYNYLKITLIIIFLFTFIQTITSYDKIVLWDNSEIKGDINNFNEKSIIINNKRIDLESISHIIFNLRENNQDKIDEKLDDIKVENLLKRAKHMEEKYPDASLLVLYDDGVQKLNKDKTRYSHSRYAVKIMKENQLSNAILSFYYVKGSHEINIIMARSISPDGEISYLDKKDISFTTPSQGLSYFSGRKDEKIIKAIIPNVKVGSIIDFEYETIDEAPEDPNQFYTGWYFGGENPIYESSVKFIVPEEKNFYWIAKNVDEWKVKPSELNVNGYKIYSFITGEYSTIIPEPDCPSIDELMPSIFGSTFKDQTYLSKWLSKFMKERMVGNKEIEKTINKIIKESDAKTEIEKLSVLYRFVQEYIHYRSIKTSLSSGFSGHPAQETFENRYGDCIDKSILFSTILGMVGIDAYPVIVKTNDKSEVLYNKIGVVSGNHAITEIHLKEKEKKIIYLDSTSTTYRYPVFRGDDQGILAWNPILNTVRKIECLDPVWNTQVFEKDIKLNSNGDGFIKSHNIYSGDTEAGIRGYFLSLKKQEIKALLSSIIARDFPGSVLREYNFKNPVDFSNNMFLDFSYDAYNIAKRTGDFLIMNIPVFYDFSNLSLKDRKYPLVFTTTEGKRYKITITIPEGYKIKGLPESIIIKNKYFSYKSEYKIESNKIIFSDHYERYYRKIPVEDYQKYREDMLNFDYKIKNPLIFEKE